MIRKRIEELQDGDVLAKPVTTWNYQMILQAGFVLKRDYIGKFRELNVREVWVEQEGSAAEEIGILRDEVEFSVKEKVRDILERHTYHNNRELEKLNEEADHIITSILDEKEVVGRVYDIRERSMDIYEHSVNICSLAILTALKLNVEKEKIHDIGVGCLLHDIGLRYMAIDIENRAEEDMSPPELAEYRKHPIYGYTDLKDETWISELGKDIVLCHHERLDGSGFPLRKKEQSPECGIVNVCDAFDEMICGLGQRRRKVCEVLEYLKVFRGKQFDENAVDTLLRFVAVYPAGSKVLTNEGELAVVVSQNREFQDRPVIRILRDRDGNDVEGERLKDLMKIHSLFIDKVLE